MAYFASSKKEYGKRRKGRCWIVIEIIIKIKLNYVINIISAQPMGKYVIKTHKNIIFPGENNRKIK